MLKAGERLASLKSVNTIILIISILFNVSLWAQDIHHDENKYLGYIYQQDSYNLNDPKGDILLLWTARQIHEYVGGNLKGNQKEILEKRQSKISELLAKYPQYSPKEETVNIVIKDHETVNKEHEPIVLEGHKAPFKIKNVSLMLQQVIIEEIERGIIPKTGDIHEWSPEIRKELKKEFFLFGRMSKLLLALSRGVTSFYMVSGTEEELKSYIISRPDNSINLEEMFRASYRINKGDVYLSLLTIENVLSRFWSSPQRSKRLISTKLKHIINFNYSADKFGAWYHLFGMMLYGYASGGPKASIVGNLETLGSQIMSRFQDERQENYINAKGGPIGGRLKRFIKKQKYKEFKANPDYVAEDFYMDLDEDFTKRLSKKKARI